MAYSDLSIREKAEIIRMGVRAGLNNLKDIQSFYDSVHTEPILAEGGSINIKHPGRLTALKERTGKTEAELWATGNAHTRKMITFARNARKWKHDDGGHLYWPGGFFSNLANRLFGKKEEAPTYARVHENDSPTKEQSEQYEDRMNQRLSVQDSTYDHKWDIPYLDDKEIKIAGHRVSSNALDSIAKYAGLTGVPVDEAVGLAMYETHLGAAPFLNYTEASDNATAEEKARVAATNRALGNASFFRNYHYIPAWALIRDNEYIQEGYNETKEQKAAGMSPLEHGLLYYKSGRYNPGLGKGVHTKNVKEKAAIIRNDPAYQQWLSTRAAGGPLSRSPFYPFSYGDIPAVRYEDGGKKKKPMAFQPNREVNHRPYYLYQYKPIGAGQWVKSVYKTRPNVPNIQNMVDELDPYGPDRQYVWDSPAHDTYTAWELYQGHVPALQPVRPGKAYSYFDVPLLEASSVLNNIKLQN